MKLQENVELSTMTTLQLGGKVRFFIACSSADDVLEGLVFAKKKGLPYFIIGQGSNIIPVDQDVEAVALHIRIQGVQMVSQNPDKGLVTIRVGAGESWDPFVQTCIEKGFSGLECMSGIPGYVGAVPVQNVGAYGQDVSQTITQVEVISPNGSQQLLSNADCGFSYRDSKFKSGDHQEKIILRVHFTCFTDKEVDLPYPELERKVLESLPNGLQSFKELERRKKLELVRESVLHLRKQKSMLIDSNDPESKSAGSFFLNPILDEAGVSELLRKNSILGNAEPPLFPLGDSWKVSAAWLVEKAGFPKGFEKNGVGVSRSHSLALVNRGGKAQDLLSLSEEIQRQVQDLFGVTLVQEPILLTNCLKGL